MRYSKAHKEKTRSSILQAALNTFRTEGFNGIGVDGIAKAAGVTSGAFYKHFASKAEAFQSVVTEGFSSLRNAIIDYQGSKGPNWLNIFVKWYFSFPSQRPDGACGSLLPLEGGCALPSLTPEISRTDPATKQLFEGEIYKIVEAIALGLPKELKQKKRLSWSILALLLGGVVLARSVRNEKTASDISSAVAMAIKQLTDKPKAESS